MNMVGSQTRQRSRQIMNLVALMRQPLAAIPSLALEGPPPKASGEGVRWPSVPEDTPVDVVGRGRTWAAASRDQRRAVNSVPWPF